MTTLINSLSDVAPGYDALFCDLWGCLHNGVAAFPAAVAALRAFRASGGQVVLLTNAPRPNSFVIAQLDRLGVPKDAYDIVVSSGDAAQYGMLSGAVGQRIWHLGPAKDEGFFSDIPPDLVDPVEISRVALDEAEGIVCTGPFHEDSETPDDYEAQFLFAKARGLTLLCANPDIVVDLGDRRIYCAGALAQRYEAMGGSALYYGKPHPPVYDLARRRLSELGHSVADGAILAIGDGIATDVQGGLGEGIDTLFITGGLAAAAFGPDVDAPDADLLDTWLTTQKLSPTYAMGRLR